MKILFILFILAFSTNLKAGFFEKFSNKSPTWPWGENSLCKGDACTLNEDLNNLNKANKFCRDVYNFYENSLNTQNRTPYIVGILGSLAGVFSPISSGDTAKGLSSFSGAANALQLSTTKAMQSTVSINTLKFIDQLVYAVNQEFVSATSERTIISINMASRCAYAASSVEAKVLEATQEAINKLNDEQKNLIK
ncbi:hypothetical protein [Acinetobacter sp. ESBL14]|uniref:hypothetical protein n=1 Tax=Acinetobacter sp. ESBL14 TaxID=3077329 RepID=UPI002FCA0188